MTKTKTSTDCPDCLDTGHELVFGEPCSHPHMPKPKKAPKPKPMSTEGQFALVKKLLEERPISFPHPDKLLSAVPTMTKKDASGIIDAMMKMPVEHHKPRPNGYSGNCKKCGGFVEAGAGRIEKIGGQWKTFHLDGACLTPEAVAAATAVAVTEPGMYRMDGSFYKVKPSYSGRLYALRVVVSPEHGVGFVFDRNAIHKLNPADKMTAAEAHEFGMAYDTCVNCGKALTDEKSVVAKYGHTCAKNLGWRYPTKKEATAVLAGEITWAEILG